MTCNVSPAPSSNNQGVVRGRAGLDRRRSESRRAKGAEINMNKPETRKIETTLGDLIAAASEVAFEHSNNDLEAYNMARLALVEILRRTSHPFDLNEDFEDVETSSRRLH
jgi:hypothetical protein